MTAERHIYADAPGKTVLVGLCPPRELIPYPFAPETKSGAELARVLGLPIDRAFALANAIPWHTETPRGEAERTSARILRRTLVGRTLILLGLETAQALRYPATRHYEGIVDEDGTEWQVFPHPSRRSRIWNDAEAREKFERALRVAAFFSMQRSGGLRARD